MERQQKLVGTARPPLVGIRMLGVTLHRNFFGTQKLVHKNRRESCIVENPCFNFGPCDCYIEQPSLLAIRKAVACRQHILQRRVIAYEWGKAIGVLVALEQNHIGGFKPFGFVHGQEFDLAATDDIVKSVPLFDAFIHEREVVIVEWIPPQQEHRFVGRNGCNKLSDDIAIAVSVVGLER